MQLDSRTITLVGMAACMLFSMLGVMVAKRRHTCPGFHHWTIANLCASLALLLIGLRGMIPDAISIVVGNVLSIGAGSLVIEGIRRFRGKKSFWPAYAGGAITLALIIYFRYGNDSLNTRIAVLSLYLGYFGVIAAVQFIAAARPGYALSLKFTAAMLALHGAVQVARGLYFYTHPILPSLYAPSAIYAVTMAGTVLGIIAWSFGFFLINHDHLVEHLKNAESRAISADNAKSDFIANVSHEIRTPMNGVIGLTELLLDTPLDRTQRDYAETVHESGMALLEIINELLDLSKIEAGKIDLTEAPFDPRDVVERVVKLLTWKAQDKGLPLLWEVEPDVPRTVVGDAGRLRQMLMNLAGNALKFTNRGEIGIRVSLDAPYVLRFSVRDTGPGIARTEQAKLFERFEQLDGDERGSGLGLAISKELSQLMGGKIGVISGEGEGSTFWFTAAFKKPSSFESLSLRVLVVDDSVINQKVASGLLEKIGCEARVAGDGRAAVDLISREPFDLVLMDCQMPDMDGFRATEEIRRTSAVPIIAMTGDVRDEDRRKCLDAGMDGHISKPVSLGSLTEAVHSCVLNRT